MRIQCNLLSFFLLGIVVIASIVEASGKKWQKKKWIKKGKQSGNPLPPSSIFLDDSLEAEHVIVPSVSKTSDFSSSSTSESIVAQDVIDALAENGFVSINRDLWGKWIARKDLFDHVVMKSVDFIIEFIKQVKLAKILVLATLFIKRLDIVDQVLDKIECDGNDLINLTHSRPELAESHESFFTALDKMKIAYDQERAVRRGVENLFNAEKHASVIPLIIALEERQFTSENLKDVAIQCAFYEAAHHDIKNIIDELYEHPTIAPEQYVGGLIRSWRNHDGSNPIFSFLLSQADQGDLPLAKLSDVYVRNPDFRKAINDALSKAPPTETRLVYRPIERAKLGIKTLNDVMRTGEWRQEPGIIIASYLLGEEEGRNVIKGMN